MKTKPKIPYINIDPSITWDIQPNYKFIKFISSGTSGSVCDALCIKTQVHVAIKRFRNAFHDMTRCKRVLREVELLYTINHPCIVRPYDVFIRQADLYLVMEKGQIDLERLRKMTYLVDSQVKIIMYRLLLALNYIHSGGILHRDIKPANVLVNSDCTVKLCDFSLSRGPLVCCKTSASTELFVEESEDSKEMNEEIIEKPKTVHCKFEVKFKKAIGKKRINKESIAFLELKREEQNLLTMPTSHVATRWYRAPEIILLEKEYNSAMDIWGAGCVFAELLEMTKENQLNIDERLPLFPGYSCFPLSPSLEARSEMLVTPKDQLNVILNNFGQLSTEDLAFLKSPESKEYVQALSDSLVSNKKKRINFEENFPGAEPKAIDLLSKLLVFNPNHRITAKEALRHPYFDRVRNKQQETIMKEQELLQADIDNNLSMQELTKTILNNRS